MPLCGKFCAKTASVRNRSDKRVSMPYPRIRREGQIPAERAITRLHESGFLSRDAKKPAQPRIHNQGRKQEESAAQRERERMEPTFHQIEDAASLAASSIIGDPPDRVQRIPQTR